jgi:beta-N-acetylhexosaminidase
MGYNYAVRPRHLFFNALSVLALIAANLFAPLALARAQTPPPVPSDQMTALLEQMTPEERVGQLFLVTFHGTDVSSSSQIYSLISQYHVSGVTLSSLNDNIVGEATDPTATITGVNALIRGLQQSEWNSSLQTVTSLNEGTDFVPKYIPLFVALSQEGDGYPYDQILHGVTVLPDEMALGGTWTPDLATQVGNILGKELATIGINLLMGPSLDVLESPQLDLTQNLSTRTFGGDPYWVGEMGRAYIRGVHQGSQGTVAVISKYFPGHGNSDRLPEEEVATVRKSLDELTTFDLSPFFAVTGHATTADETTDALLISHIRYQGLQGNIRATTRPVSFDPQALALLMELPPLKTWRENGGVMVSADLGNLAVRRFYDLTNQAFDARRVALNAFLAGNDLLYISNFANATDPDSYTAAIRTLDFFAQKYRDDPAFAQRVDASVLRVLTLKSHLYPSFLLSTVRPGISGLSDLGTSSQVTFDVARRSATLLSPTQADLDVTVPDPPNLNDRIVFISDTRTGQQCSTCAPYPLLGLKALQDAVIRLYGPQAGGQVTPNNLSSYSLNDLEAMLAAEENGTALQRDLERANWIVFGMLSNRSDLPSFQTLEQFLTERPDLFQQKRLFVFAFCAPFYLDATNISKLTAYYSLYSKAPQFVDVAAYLLFGELRAPGAPPVSVAGIGYNLNAALFPNPAIPIPLQLDLPAPILTTTAVTTPEPTPPPEFRLGDVIPLRAGVIVDYNGNPVPDGTPVTFTFSYGSEAATTRQIEFTQQGVAHTTYAVNGPGTLEIHAESENAQSAIIKVDIPTPGGEVVTFTPTIEPTFTATIAPPTATLAPEETPQPSKESDDPRLANWFIAVLISAIVALSIYRMSSLAGQVRWGIRAGLMALIGGLLAYSLLALRGSNSEGILGLSYPMSVLVCTVSGVFMGLLSVFAWQQIGKFRRQAAHKQPQDRQTPPD